MQNKYKFNKKQVKTICSLKYFRDVKGQHFPNHLKTIFLYLLFCSLYCWLNKLQNYTEIPISVLFQQITTQTLEKPVNTNVRINN